MSPLAPYAITLQSSDDGSATFVGTRSGDVISDEELFSHCPQLGRALMMMRRMGDIMVRTVDARGRRGTLLAELAEWCWNEELSTSLGQPRMVAAEFSAGRREPSIDASAIWTFPE